jgi:hypothetical protein
MHTPTPWAIFHDHPKSETAASIAYIRRADAASAGVEFPAIEIASVFLCNMEGKTGAQQTANADLIVRAVNALDDLIAALQICTASLELTSPKIKHQRDAICIANQALKLAGVKP